MSDDIRTCSASLLTPGTCCFSICTDRATQAVLVAQHDHLVEHARCHAHVHDHQENFIGAKPLQWNPLWGPESREPERQTWEHRRIGAGTDLALHLEVDDQGRVRIHESVLARVLHEAGWERTA